MEFIANLFDGSLAAFLLVGPFLLVRRQPVGTWPWKFWRRASLGIVLVYVVTYADRWLGVWAHFGKDFSTHTAFAVSIATSLALFFWEWTLFLVPFLMVFAGWMIKSHYHSAFDVVSSTLLQVPITWLCHFEVVR